jgi:hypothetical protein
MGWTRDVFARYLLVAAISSTLAATIVATLPASNARIALVVGVCSITTLIAAYKLGLNDDERNQFRAAAHSLGGRIASFRAKLADTPNGGPK